MTITAIEQVIVDALPPYMQRRMAMLSLSGVRFDHVGVYIADRWVARGRDEPPSRPTRIASLADCINSQWTQAIYHKAVQSDTGYQSGDALEALEDSRGVAPD